MECLDSIPGIDRSSASAIFAEMGPDIATRFPTVEQFTSWAGVSPGNNESAGRKKSRKCLQGNKKEGTPYKEIDMQARMSKQRTANFYVKKLQELGFALELTENETS
ncbi:IS110 family transposase [Paenibacillus thiaminolyticus]|uniref:IS110 family transposase n=2 Tax=Paenibacillus thiaminolyticus TaxID=49283 RepID=UPI003B984C6D